MKALQLKCYDDHKHEYTYYVCKKRSNFHALVIALFFILFLVFLEVDCSGANTPASSTEHQQHSSFSPLKVPQPGDKENGTGLIKPSSYLNTVDSSTRSKDEITVVGTRLPATPLHKAKSDLANKQLQPLAAISIQDLHSVQLKKTPGAAKIMNNSDRQQQSAGKENTYCKLSDEPLSLHLYSFTV